jgi:hypothetical protein
MAYGKDGDETKSSVLQVARLSSTSRPRKSVTISKKKQCIHENNKYLRTKYQYRNTRINS